MKERPILFSAPMVLALLDGSKAQTRRVIKDKTLKLLGYAAQAGECGQLGSIEPIPDNDQAYYAHLSPHGQPGDRLFVRETLYAFGRWITQYSAKKKRDEWRFIDLTLECGKAYRYAASMPGDNGPRQRGSVTPQWWKRPAIFMPRVASRITTEITGVRVERLQDISEADAIAEGASQHPDGPWHAYRSLWTLINGPGSWDANPWVWVIEFRRITT